MIDNQTMILIEYNFDEEISKKRFLDTILKNKNLDTIGIILCSIFIGI